MRSTHVSLKKRSQVHESEFVSAQDILKGLRRWHGPRDDFLRKAGLSDGPVVPSFEHLPSRTEDDVHINV